MARGVRRPPGNRGRAPAGCEHGVQSSGLNARLQDECGDRWDSEQTNQLARGGSLVPEWHEMLNYSSTDYCYLVAFLDFS